MSNLTLYLGVMLAGGAGALLRFLLGRTTTSLGWTLLPFGTLIANVFGSFLMGYLAYSLSSRWEVSRDMQIIVLTGLLGGFTTFSAFSLETVKLIEQGDITKSVVYVLGTVAVCLCACILGGFLARHAA